MNVGNHSDFKNVVRLAEAHQKLLEKHPELGLVFICKQTDAVRINERLFEERGYKNIHFTHYIRNSQRDYIYTKAAAYITPSLREGFGLVA